MDRVNQPIGTLLAEAIERERRAKFAEEANRDYAALRQRPLEWQEEIAEREAWGS